MNFKIKHKIPGRIRVHMGQSRMSFDQADTLQYFLETQPGDKSDRIRADAGCGDRV